MTTLFFILSILLAYASYSCVLLIKLRIETMENRYLKHGINLGPSFNYSSGNVIIPLVVVFICPTLSLFLYFESSAYWMILVYFIINMALFNLVGSNFMKFVLESVGLEDYLDPKNTSSGYIVIGLSLASIIFLLISYLS